MNKYILSHRSIQPFSDLAGAPSCTISGSSKGIPGVTETPGESMESRAGDGFFLDHDGSEKGPCC